MWSGRPGAARFSRTAPVTVRWITRPTSTSPSMSTCGASRFCKPRSSSLPATSTRGAPSETPSACAEGVLSFASQRRSAIRLGNPHAAPVRAGRALRRHVRIRPDLLEHCVDGLVELRVPAAHHEGRVVHHDDVRIDAVALDAPCSILLVVPEGGNADRSAVNEARVAGDAHQPAPGAHADERPDLHLLEVAREGIAAGA